MKANETPENYPIQFKDRLDEYLWKEHHIIGGCCSSIENMKYVVAREVAEKLTDALIEKACDAYCRVCGHYHHTVPYEICRHDCNYYDDFKKHLKEE